MKLINYVILQYFSDSEQVNVNGKHYSAKESYSVNNKLLSKCKQKYI